MFFVVAIQATPQETEEVGHVHETALLWTASITMNTRFGLFVMCNYRIYDFDKEWCVHLTGNSSYTELISVHVIVSNRPTNELN